MELGGRTILRLGPLAFRYPQNMKFLAVILPIIKSNSMATVRRFSLTFIALAEINKPLENSMISGHSDTACRPTELNSGYVGTARADLQSRTMDKWAQ